MSKLRFSSDRSINTTENNEYAEGYRDENLIEKDGIDSEIPLDDEIPDIVNESGEEDRPIYNEEGYENDPGN